MGAIRRRRKSAALAAAAVASLALSACSGNVGQPVLDSLGVESVATPWIPTPTAEVPLSQPTGCPPRAPSTWDLAGGAPATPTFADVAYADVSPSQELDLYLPPGKGPFPMVMRIHGGAFQAGNSTMAEADVQKFLAAGFALASVNYRLSCEALFPAAPQDVFAAVRFLRANAEKYKLDPQQFALWGESAGANLAALVGVAGGRNSYLDDPALGNADTSSAVQAVVGWIGPYNFLTMDAEFAARTPAECGGELQLDLLDSALTAYLGAPMSEVPELADAASPGSAYPYVVPGVRFPPFLLAAGSADCLIPTEQSAAFNRLLNNAGGTSEIVVLPGAGHLDAGFKTYLAAPTLQWLRDNVDGRPRIIERLWFWSES